MNIRRSIFTGAALLALPAEAQEHRFEADPIVTVRENFVACDVLSQLQRVMDNPLSVPKIRFCNNGDEVRRGRAQIQCRPRTGWRDGSERPC